MLHAPVPLAGHQRRWQDQEGSPRTYSSLLIEAALEGVWWGKLGCPMEGMEKLCVPSSSKPVGMDPRAVGALYLLPQGDPGVNPPAEPGTNPSAGGRLDRTRTARRPTNTSLGTSTVLSSQTHVEDTCGRAEQELVLDYFPHKQAMAVDVAMQLYLCSSPLRREKCACKIAPKASKPLRPCIQLSGKTALSGAEAANSFTHNKVKKRVSFADSRGFALTMVKVFSEFDDPLDIPFNITELIDDIVGLTTVERDSFVLDFVQPSVDYLDFRNRLQADCVCLENCMLKERSVVGTVKVKNLAFEKTVKIRMTFDTWKNFVDYPCQYVKDTYGGSDRDTFSFDIRLPEGIQSHERVEFAISFECNGKVYWDSNRGTNYRIIRSELKSAQEAARPPQGPDFSSAFDQFGSPRCSYGLFPEWPSYSGYEKLGPYY